MGRSRWQIRSRGAGSTLSLTQLRASEALGLPAAALHVTPRLLVVFGALLLREACVAGAP